MYILFNVESLMILAEDYVILNKDNCLRLLILADRYTATRLKDSTLKFKLTVNSGKDKTATSTVNINVIKDNNKSNDSKR